MGFFLIVEFWDFFIYIFAKDPLLDKGIYFLIILNSFSKAVDGFLIFLTGLFIQNHTLNFFICSSYKLSISFLVDHVFLYLSNFCLIQGHKLFSAVFEKLHTLRFKTMCMVHIVLISMILIYFFYKWLSSYSRIIWQPIDCICVSLFLNDLSSSVHICAYLRLL